MDLFPVVSPDERHVASMNTDAQAPDCGPVQPSGGAGLGRAGGAQQLFVNWSPDGTKLSVGCYAGGGLWIYDVEKKEASKVLDGSFSWCVWSDRQRSRMALEKTYWQWHHEIWITNRPLDTAQAASPAHTAESM